MPAAGRPVGTDTWVTFGVQLGNFTGLRAQFLPIGSGPARLALEGFYGGSATAAGIAETVGGGLRLQLNVTDDGRNDALYVSPGLDVYLAYGDSSDTSFLHWGPYDDILFLAANTDVSWVHEFAIGAGFELGLHLGGVVALGGRNSNNQDSAGQASPEIGLFTGMRF